MDKTKTKEELLHSLDDYDSYDGISDASIFEIMQIYADQQSLAALEAFKADAIYCNGDGIASLKIEDYLNRELR